MSVKILSVSLVWLFFGASALSQAPTEQQKKYQQDQEPQPPSKTGGFDFSNFMPDINKIKTSDSN